MFADYGKPLAFLTELALPSIGISISTVRTSAGMKGEETKNLSLNNGKKLHGMSSFGFS